MVLSELEELEMLRLRKQKALASQDAPDQDYSHEGRPRDQRKRGYFPTTEAETLGAAGAEAAGIPEAALQIGSGIVGSVAGGLAGIGKTGLELARGKGLSESAAAGGGTARSVQEALTFQPRSESGKAVSSAASLPMEVANKLLGRGGAIVGKAAGDEAAGETIGENIVPTAMTLAGGARALRRPMDEAAPVAGKDYTPLRQLSMSEEERYQRQKAQGVQPTLGSVTRDPSQVRFEQQTAGEAAGRPLYQRGIENDAALARNVEAIKEQPGPVGPNIKGARDINAADTGRSVRSVVEAKKAAADAKVNELYDKARAAGETKAEVDVSPLVRYLKENEPAAVSVKQLKSISAGLRKLMGVEEDTAPTPVGSGKISSRIKKPAEDSGPPRATIDDLEFLRQEAGKLMQADGSVKSYMGDVRQIIDKITEGKGGDLYKQARAQRRAVGKEFEDQAGVANIIDKKSATDYKVAGEDVWRKTVVNGSTDDLTNVIRTLRTVDDKQKPQAAQALKDMQARSIDMILEEGTKTGTMSKAGLERGIKTIGEEKLNLLIGKDAVQKLRDTVTTTGELKTPPLRVPGSDTKLNMRVEAERMATDHGLKIMKGVLPRPFSYIAKGAEMLREGSAKRAEQRRLAADVDEALTPTRASLSSIAQEAGEQTRARRKYVMGETASRLKMPAASTITDKEDN